jgi:CO/xanthine dehydrogenase Mo-binding subunit
MPRGQQRHHPHAQRAAPTTYGKVALAAAKVTPPAEVKLKDPKDWKLAGKRLARLDTVDKVTGKQVYGADLKLPGMLNAAIKDCPVFGGKVKSFNAAAIEKRPGVKKVLRVGDSAVAVVADTWWRAKTALDALPIEWDNGPNAAKVSSASVAALLKAGLDAPEAVVGNQNGDAKAALASARQRIEAVYSYPHQNHATMEPMNATARWTPERCEVWTPTQNGEAALAAASEAAGLPAANARSTRSTWAAASAGAARCTTGCARPSTSPNRCRARRSSCSGRARRTCCTAATTRSRSASCRPGWTRRATSPRCTCASRASPSWPACFRKTSRTARTRCNSRA